MYTKPTNPWDRNNIAKAERVINPDDIKLNKNEDDGSKYSGDLKEGIKHGKGKCIYADGSIYEGEWAQGLFSGKGTLVMADG